MRITFEMNYLLSKLQLREIMTKDVITCQANDTIKLVAARMQENKIGALPVIDDKKMLLASSRIRMCSES